jgi:hypothetical protein
MSFFVVEPPDPDCPRCHGAGTVCEFRPGDAAGMASVSVGDCGCRAFANRRKVRERCDHEFTCRKCGESHH